MDGSSLTKGGGTATDLRIAILDAFEEAGIASPFLRTDVTLRNIDWLRGIVADYDSDSLQRKDVSHREVSFRNVTKKVCDAPSENRHFRPPTFQRVVRSFASLPFAFFFRYFSLPD
jgi:hypothetical protein